MKDTEKIKEGILHLKHYIWLLAVMWTVVVSVSLIWNLTKDKNEIFNAARIQASVAYEKDLIYRLWNTEHGGVYVPVTEKTLPNSNLSKIPERDITTPSGKLLTLISPVSMTRHVHELEDKQYGVSGNITSLNMIYKENAPDPWETEALIAFERGETEISSVEEMEGEDYMRLMRPLIIEKNCLKCHASQGYKIGDICGGLSISIPMAPLRAIGRSQMIALYIGHGLIWLFGLVSIVLLSKQIMRSERERMHAAEALQKANDELDTRINEKTAEIIQANEELRIEIIERKRVEEQIKGYSQNLESMVGERTKELNRSLYNTEKARDEIDGILKSVADGLIVTDIYKNVILMNRAAEDLLGIRLSEVINRPIEFAIEEKTMRGKFLDSLRRRKTGYQFDFEFPGDDPQHPRFMSASTSVIYDKERNYSGIVTIFHDVTHERVLDRMKTEFLSTTAHELRNPLTSIQGFSEILQTREDLSEEEKKKFLSYINKQSVALSKIINDLLDISRLESGLGFSLNKTPCNTGDIIKQVIPYFKEHAPKHMFEVVLPERPVELTVDKDKVEEALKNLLNNAVKYSPDGGVIRVVGEVSEDYYQVSVEDQGIGMTQEQVEKVFDKFYRADASDVAVEGTGLGMSIVKHIVEAHGGKVWVESKQGKRTTVRFTLPMKS